MKMAMVSVGYNLSNAFSVCPGLTARPHSRRSLSSTGEERERERRQREYGRQPQFQAQKRDARRVETQFERRLSRRAHLSSMVGGLERHAMAAASAQCVEQDTESCGVCERETCRTCARFGFRGKCALRQHGRRALRRSVCVSTRSQESESSEQKHSFYLS